ncbi:hypothetical protein FOA52_002649 [Chlamydomonas sp. UWO 241]|nr:hypothetical protein FOA52_002649 [Chlamydomonas sp. UWO 241]
MTRSKARKHSAAAGALVASAATTTESPAQAQQIASLVDVVSLLMARDGIVRGALRDASYLGSTRHVRRLFSDCYGSEETAVAAAAVRVAAAAVDGVSLPVCLAMNLVRFVHDVSGRDRPAGGGVVSASFLNAKPAVGGIGVEPRRGGVLRVLFTVASDAVADTVVRSRRNLRDVDPSAAVFDVLSDREEAQHRALWPAFLAAKAAGKRAQFHRARLVVDGERRTVDWRKPPGEVAGHALFSAGDATRWREEGLARMCSALPGMRTVADVCALWAWLAAVDMVRSTRTVDHACLVTYASAAPARAPHVLGQFRAALACVAVVLAALPTAWVEAAAGGAALTVLRPLRQFSPLPQEGERAAVVEILRLVGWQLPGIITPAGWRRGRPGLRSTAARPAPQPAAAGGGAAEAADRLYRQAAPPVPAEDAAPDAIKRILAAWEKHDYFDLMQMAQPTVDDLGKPTWGCTPGDVSRAYRKLSILVHPDKNPGEQARKAFEALNAAHRSLKDPDLLGEVLRKAGDRLRRERDQAEARATPGERIELNSIRNARQKELRKEEGKIFGDTIAHQMKRKQEEMQRKTESAKLSRAAQMRAAEAAGGGAPGDDNDSDDEGQRVVKKKKRPGFM